jgi:hypothetical protein
MRTFLRKNMMIVVSIALPLLVVLFFALASILPGLYSNPPEHDLLLSFQGRATSKTSQVRIDLSVIDGQLKAVTRPLDNTYYSNNPRLFRYHHLSGDISEISIPVPDNIAELEDGTEIPIPELAGVRVSDKLRAPDGYEFSGRRSGGGFITEMFGGSQNRNYLRISKNGAVIRVRLPASDYWYNDARFLGWVLHGEE